MANSYEDQCRIWASNKYDIPFGHISKATVELEVESQPYAGCDTCGWGADDAATIEVRVFDQSGSIIERRSISHFEFTNVLQEIIEAQLPSDVAP